MAFHLVLFYFASVRVERGDAVVHGSQVGDSPSFVRLSTVTVNSYCKKDTWPAGQLADLVAHIVAATCVLGQLLSLCISPTLVLLPSYCLVMAPLLLQCYCLLIASVLPRQCLVTVSLLPRLSRIAFSSSPRHCLVTTRFCLVIAPSFDYRGIVSQASPLLE